MKTILKIFILSGILFIANSCKKEVETDEPTNEKVYIAGWTNSFSSPYFGTYWVNGVAVNFPTGSKLSEANAIFVSGADVYVAGRE